MSVKFLHLVEPETRKESYGKSFERKLIPGLNKSGNEPRRLGMQSNRRTALSTRDFHYL